MAITVFISYAGRDPQWPSESVRALGLELEQLGATVLLDQFHLERQAEPGKLSAAEWRDWMSAALQQADRVICLVSARYAQAVGRDLEEAWGYGVAYESLKLLGRLYRKKGHNNKWILALRPDGASLDHIPEDLQDSCPEYQWPSERVAVLEHATKRHRREFDNNAEDPPAGDSNALPIEAGLVAQARLALVKLRDHPDFFGAIIRNKEGEVLDVAPPTARAEPGPFIQWLSEASLDDAQAVMWAVRTALEENPAFRSDCRVQEAAVAVYMLSALRWVQSTTMADDGSRVVAVPTLGRNVLAVLSAAFFGGRIQYAFQAGTPQPLHVYDVRAPIGEAAPVNLLRAIYGALFAEEYGALEIARRDDDDPNVIGEMVQRLQSRLNEIRRRRRLSFTLIIDRADAFQEAPWANKLDVTPFVVDEQLAQAVFLLKPHQLDQEINELMRQIHPRAAEAPQPPPAIPAQPNVMPQSSPINVHLHGDNANLSFGNQSPITSHVEQSQATVPLEEFRAAIQALKDEIARLQSVKARDKMSGDLALIEDALDKKPADGKGRIGQAMEAIKNAGEAADGAESVLDKLVKLKALAAPILAALF